MSGAGEDLMGGWVWDPTLYAGSAAYYADGRVPYPQALADAVAAGLGTDGTGRLLDVGCGPGSLTLLLAPLFRDTVGIDADPEMIAVAKQRAAAAGLSAVGCRQLRGEELPADLGMFRAVTFAQSLHWMRRTEVLTAVFGMLVEGGGCLHVRAATIRGVPTDGPLPHPEPPHDQIAALVGDFLGPDRRAGLGVVPDELPDERERPFLAAGLSDLQSVDVPGEVVVRTADQLVAAVYSLSSSTPYLLGEQRPAFEADLRALLAEVAADGVFSEQLREITVDCWR